MYSPSCLDRSVNPRQVLFVKLLRLAIDLLLSIRSFRVGLDHPFPLFEQLPRCSSLHGPGQPAETAERNQPQAKEGNHAPPTAAVALNIQNHGKNGSDTCSAVVSQPA